MDDKEYFAIPNTCPICNSQTIVDGFFLYCRSNFCPSKASNAIRVWIAKLGLLHWGDALIESLTEPSNPKVQSIADLYKLSVDDIAKCCSGQKFAQKCFDILHANKDITLELMLSGLNIPNLAIATATDIVQSGHDSIDKIVSLTYEDLLKIPNIGEITAKQVFSGLQSRRDLIIELSKVLNIKQPTQGPLTGCSVCITGDTSKPRKAVQKLILDAGGVVKESVGAGLSYLVTNDQTSNSKKMQKAKKCGVKVISETDLYTLINTI